MGLFGKSKKDKVDNAKSLIDKRIRKYLEVRDAYFNRKPADMNLDPRNHIMEMQEFMDAIVRDLYDIRRHLG